MISFSFQAPCTSLVATPNASDIYDLDSCVRRFIACMWGDSKDNGSPAGVWKIAISARSTVSSLVCCVHQASPCLAGLTAPSRTRISAIMIACINTTTGSKVSLQPYRELESMSVFGGYKTASLTVTVDVPKWVSLALMLNHLASRRHSLRVPCLPLRIQSPSNH